jgi:2-polyprenyl-3-methyl-5-hydroxy-6-metoxy-1,4-benzoquinol methylase
MEWNRSLHPNDYEGALRPYAWRVMRFEDHMRSRGAPFRKDHEHRTWEYANVLMQLETSFQHPEEVKVLDTGCGGSSLAPLLAFHGYDIHASDSLAYGDCLTPFIIPACTALGIEIPFRSDAVEALSYEDEFFDVSMCISVIEHVDTSLFKKALSELVRVTKPGGYVYITSDFFRDEAQANQSPFRSIQHTIFTPTTVTKILETTPELEFEGGINFAYRGDFVHNYSFVNMVFVKVDD